MNEKVSKVMPYLMICLGAILIGSGIALITIILIAGIAIVILGGTICYLTHSYLKLKIREMKKWIKKTQ